MLPNPSRIGATAPGIHHDGHHDKRGVTARIATPVASGCVIAAAAVYVGLNDPTGSGVRFPSCPLYASTGLWCPGCGITRATHALLHGDIAAAFGFNLFFPLFLGAIALGWIAWMRRSLGRPPRVPLALMPVWVPAALGTALVVFGVARNLPGLRALAP